MSASLYIHDYYFVHCKSIETFLFREISQIQPLLYDDNDIRIIFS